MEAAMPLNCGAVCAALEVIFALLTAAVMHWRVQHPDLSNDRNHTVVSLPQGEGASVHQSETGYGHREQVLREMIARSAGSNHII